MNKQIVRNPFPIPKINTVLQELQNEILEHVHQTIMGVIHAAEIDMPNAVSESDIVDFLTNATWAICSTYHTVLNASPGAAIFGRDMLFGIPFAADWRNRRLKAMPNGSQHKT